MKVLIYHHYDQDGYLSGAIMRQHFTINNAGGAIQLRVGNYDDSHDEEVLEWADRVYVLDYSLPIGLMDKYFDKIIWIDHHKTAMDNMLKIEENRNKKFAGIREIGKSGCLLTWEYLYPKSPPPKVVELVNDRDIWAWKYGEDTAAFHEASRLFLKNYEVWEDLLLSDQMAQIKLSYGHQLLSYVREIVDIYNESYAWEGMFEGHPVVFLNGSSVISGELHKRLREKFPQSFFAVVFMVKYDKVTVGLYRADSVKHVSLGKLATKYGGGGHDGAAGFSTDHDEWAKIIKESINAPGGYRRATNRDTSNPRSMS